MRIERRERAKVAIVKREALQVRRANARRRNEIAERAFVVDRCIDRRVGIGVRDVREDAFGPASLIEVVVNERDPNVRVYLAGGSTPG
jgi:hypothetical protein